MYYVIRMCVQVAIGKKAPKHNQRPKVQLHRQDNWKVAHGFMASAGINVKGIEPAGILYTTNVYLHQAAQ